MRRYRRKEIMKIYIDFDDVLCETAEYFTKIAKEMFGIDVPYYGERKQITYAEMATKRLQWIQFKNTNK